MKLYVGNLSFKTTDQTLQAAFEAFGQVSSAQVVMDRETGRSRGFGFVEMPSDDDARKAIEGMHGKNFEGRDLTVNEAKPREGGGGGRGGWGGGGGGGGGRSSGGGYGGGGGGRSGGGGYGGGGGGRSGGGGGYGGGGGGGSYGSGSGW